jgi:hypothetical protein
MGEFDRITRQPEIMGGKACIRGMRVTVGMVVGQIGAGRGIDELLVDYPTWNARTFSKRFNTPRIVAVIADRGRRDAHRSDYRAPLRQTRPIQTSPPGTAPGP